MILMCDLEEWVSRIVNERNCLWITHSWKNLFILICLAKKTRSSPTLGLIIKRDKLKHNNMFGNKLMNMSLDLNIDYIIFLYV